MILLIVIRSFPTDYFTGAKKKGPECILLPLKCWKRQLQASANRSFYLACTDLGIRYSNLIRRNRFHSLMLEKLHLEAMHYIILRISIFGLH